MRVLRNRISGKRSTSRKSGDRRCVSRWAVPVSMLAASMVASTTDRVRSASSMARVPLYFVKWPRTFETTMWRTEKLMPEWTGSMFQSLLVVVVMGCVPFLPP
jgi:hypothetical protein